MILMLLQSLVRGMEQIYRKFLKKNIKGFNNFIAKFEIFDINLIV